MLPGGPVGLCVYSCAICAATATAFAGWHFNGQDHKQGVVPQAENLDTAFELVEKMQGEGIEADWATYTTLMDLCAEARQGARALQLMQVLPVHSADNSDPASLSSLKTSLHACTSLQWLTHPAYSFIAEWCSCMLCMLRCQHKGNGVACLAQCLKCSYVSQ